MHYEADRVEFVQLHACRDAAAQASPRFQHERWISDTYGRCTRSLPLSVPLDTPTAADSRTPDT